MNAVTFDKLLLKTAFCCMASDGHIDSREVDLIKSMCEQNPLFKDFDFNEEINQLVMKINTQGKEFIRYYLGLINDANLTLDEQLLLIDFAIQTIKADEQIEYSEIKFFKNIRHRLSITDDAILAKFPDVEIFLEQDIINSSYMDKITNQYFESIELPQFKALNPDSFITNKPK